MSLEQTLKFGHVNPLQTSFQCRTTITLHHRVAGSAARAAQRSTWRRSHHSIAERVITASCGPAVFIQAHMQANSVRFASWTRGVKRHVFGDGAMDGMAKMLLHRAMVKTSEAAEMCVRCSPASVLALALTLTTCTADQHEDQSCTEASGRCLGSSRGYLCLST